MRYALLPTVHCSLSTPLQPSPEQVPPPARQRAFVEQVLAPFASSQALEAYLAEVQRPGHRSDHYRRQQPGETLVYRLPQGPALIHRFRQAIDETLPETYDWFEEKALHVTLRGLSS